MYDILNPKMEDGFLLDWSEKYPIIINNTAAKGLHHPNSPSFQACFHLFSQAVRKAVFFPLHSYSTHKIATTQLQPSHLLPPSLLTASSPLLFCFSLPWKHTRQVWQEMRQMVRMTGGTFLEGEMKGNMRKSYADTLFPLFETLYLLDHQQACEIQTCLCRDTNMRACAHTHRVHMPSIISLFDALASRLIGILRV